MNIQEQNVRDYFELETSEEREERERTVEALTPIIGAEDAAVAAALHQQIRSAPKREIARLGAELIKNQLTQPSMARRIFSVTKVTP